MGKKSRLLVEKSKGKAYPYALVPVRHQTPLNVTQDGKAHAKEQHFQGTSAFQHPLVIYLPACP